MHPHDRSPPCLIRYTVDNIAVLVFSTPAWSGQNLREIWISADSQSIRFEKGSSHSSIASRVPKDKKQNKNNIIITFKVYKKYVCAAERSAESSVVLQS